MLQRTSGTAAGPIKGLCKIIHSVVAAPRAAALRAVYASPQKEKQWKFSSGEVFVLSRRRCPYTGIVNFFADAEPLLAVGSVVKTAGRAACQWRCYLGKVPATGVAPDMRSAEVRLIRQYRKVLRAAALVEDADTHPAGEIAAVKRPVAAARDAPTRVSL
jgi:hypothetical protein